MAFLEGRPDLREILETTFFAGRAMADLYPETVETLFSGHAFPAHQAQQELETSLQLALEGFYTYSFVALRTVLELQLLGVYFSVDDRAHTEIRAWLRSEERTPAMRTMLPRIFSLPALEQLDAELAFRKRITDTYDELGGYVHTRGYKFSSSGLARTNINQFTEAAFVAYVAHAQSVIGLTAATLVGKYLIGLQHLPLWDKFGLNLPAGGLLDSGAHWLEQVMPTDVAELLKGLSDDDPDTQGIVEWVHSLPDLTEEEHQAQADKFEAEWGAHRFTAEQPPGAE